MIIESLWNALRKSRLGRFLAAAIIGALFGLCAVAQHTRSVSSLAIYSLAAAFMGVLAVGILELVDRGRSKGPGSKQGPVDYAAPPVIASSNTPSGPPPIPSVRSKLLAGRSAGVPIRSQQSMERHASEAVLSGRVLRFSIERAGSDFVIKVPKKLFGSIKGCRSNIEYNSLRQEKAFHGYVSNGIPWNEKGRMSDPERGQD